MNSPKFDINKLRVASPCAAGWENMTGDERQRHCDLCELNVYNISGMTAREVERLVTEREGRLCIRMFHRADGTVITKDCPVGLRAYQKRVATFAGAALAAVLGLFSVSFGQKDKKDEQEPKPRITRIYMNRDFNEITGTIVDLNGAVIRAAEIRLTSTSNVRSMLKSNEDGTFSFDGLPKDTYSIEITSPGFKDQKINDLRLNRGEKVTLNVTLEVGATMGEVVVVSKEENVEILGTTEPTLGNAISPQMIKDLPRHAPKKPEQ